MQLTPTPVRNAATVSSPSANNKKLVMAFDDGFADFFECALPHLQRCDFRASVFIVAGFLGSSSSWDVFPALQHLSAQQVRSIASLGHEIGSHTLTHADCSRLESRALDRELGDSKKMLEDITGTAVTSLSFPYGRWNRRAWQRAQELGYQTATVYTRVSYRCDGMIPLTGAYAFDKPEDLLSRLGYGPRSAIGAAVGWLMPHFAKGSSLYRWRKEYRL